MIGHAIDFTIKGGDGEKIAIPKNYFYNLTMLKTITVDADQVELVALSVRCNPDKTNEVESITINSKASIESLQSNTFDHFPKLTSLTINAHIEEVKEGNARVGAFNDLGSDDAGVTINLNGGVDKLSGHSFKNIKGTSTINIACNGSTMTVDRYGLPNSEKINVYIKHIVSADGSSYGKDFSYLYDINENAFAEMKALESVCIGKENDVVKGILYIGANAFKNCSALESLTINSERAQIKANAFSGCSGLESVILLDDTAISQEIEADAFKGAPNIKYLRMDKFYGLPSGAFAVTAGKVFVQNSTDGVYAGLGGAVGKFDVYVFAANPSGINPDVFSGANVAPTVYFANADGLSQDLVKGLVKALQNANSALKDVYLDCAREDFPLADELVGIQAKIHFHDNVEINGFYLDGVAGDDASADGTKDHPYKTFAKLAEAWVSLAPSNGSEVKEDLQITQAVSEAYQKTNVTGTPGSFKTTITNEKKAFIKNTVTVSGNESWQSGTGEVLTLYRVPDFGGAMVVVDGGSLTIENLTLDGNKAETSANGPIIQVNGGTLTLNSGAVLQNNSYPGAQQLNGAAISASASSVNIHGGSKITGNKAKYGGGIYISGGTLTMDGGSISSNEAEFGGGVTVSGGKFDMSGGDISGNTASGGNPMCGGVLLTK